MFSVQRVGRIPTVKKRHAWHSKRADHILLRTPNLARLGGPFLFLAGQLACVGETLLTACDRNV